MKFSLFIDREREEEVIVYAHKNSKLVNDIRDLAHGADNAIIGYKNDELIRIEQREVCCFTIENNKLYALTLDEKLLVKQRLYQIEEKLDSNFVKINQSSIANINFIDRFDTSIGGTLIVLFKNRHKDYVSRRQLKLVKKRIGL